MELLDATDKRILELLQEDATLSVKAIAGTIGLTVSPTYDRISRLKKEGIVQKQVMLVSREKVGLNVSALCLINLKEHSSELARAFEESAGALREVTEISRLSGNFDYMLKVVMPDLAAYNSFLEQKLAPLPNIRQVQSCFEMKEVKRETSLPLV